MHESASLNNEQRQEGARDLRSEVLGGLLTHEQFIDEIFAKDQADQSRSAAETNLALLNDPEIALQLSQDSEVADQYYNLASVSAFHIAQQKLSEGDFVGALPYLQQSANAAEKVAWPDYAGWKKYVLATSAYANGKQEEFLRLFGEFPDSDSYRETLVRLAAGLQEHGTFDYKRDYGGG